MSRRCEESVGEESAGSSDGIASEVMTGNKSTRKGSKREAEIVNSDCISTSEGIQIPETNSTDAPVVQTSFSLSSLVAPFSKFSKEKLEIIREMGFQSVLKLMPNKQFPRQLAMWVIRSLKSAEGGVAIGKKGCITVTESDVELVIGIPRKSRIVRCDCEPSEIDVSRMKRILMLQENDKITLECVETVLKHEYGRKMDQQEIEAFRVAFILYVDAYFLGAKGPKPTINQDMITNLLVTESISELNWCGYVLNCLIESSMRVKQTLRGGHKTVTLEGCLLFAVVFYLDNLDFGMITPSKEVLPRFLSYPQGVLTKLAKDDREGKSTDGIVLYGRNDVLKDNRVIYSRNRAISTNTSASNEQESVNSGAKEVREPKINEIMGNWEQNVRKITMEAREEICKYFAYNGHEKNDMTETSSIVNDNKECRAEEKGTIPEMDKIMTMRSSFQPEMSENPIYDNENCESPKENKGKEENVSFDSGADLKNAIVPVCNKKTMSSIIEPTSSDEGDYMAGSGDENGQCDKSEGEYCITPSEWNTGEFLNSAFGTPMDIETYRELERQVIDKLMEMGIEINGKNESSGKMQDDCNGPTEVACPQPILIVTPSVVTDIVCYEGENLEGNYEGISHFAIGFNNTRMVIQYINVETRFGISPFAIGLTHQDTTLEAQLGLLFTLRNISDEDKMRKWYIHLTPYAIEIQGGLIQRMFQGEIDFIPKTMDAIVRLYNQMDDQMYLKWDEKRWRHFLPTEFAVWALNKNRGPPPLRVEEMFYGTNISYKVADCRLIMVPVLVNWGWCLYVWDFQKEEVVVLDPRSNGKNEGYMEVKHKQTLGLIHSAMKQCHEAFINDYNKYMDDWAFKYISINGVHIESGLYTMFSARYFDGEVVTRILTKEASQLQRVNLMCQLLMMKGNIGKKPVQIEQAMKL